MIPATLRTTDPSSLRMGLAFDRNVKRCLSTCAAQTYGNEPSPAARLPGRIGGMVRILTPSTLPWPTYTYCRKNIKSMVKTGTAGFHFFLGGSQVEEYTYYYWCCSHINSSCPKSRVRGHRTGPKKLERKNNTPQQGKKNVSQIK